MPVCRVLEQLDRHVFDSASLDPGTAGSQTTHGAIQDLTLTAGAEITGARSKELTTAALASRFWRLFDILERSAHVPRPGTELLGVSTDRGLARATRPHKCNQRKQRGAAKQFTAREVHGRDQFPANACATF